MESKFLNIAIAVNGNALQIIKANGSVAGLSPGANEVSAFIELLNLDAIAGIEDPIKKRIVEFL